MKRRKLKSFVIPTISATLVIISIFTMSIIMKKDDSLKESDEVLTYVSNTILDQDIAVMNTDVKIINPYTDASVTIGKYFYDYKGTAENQEKSIIYHDGTYLQNSGIDFVSENVFDIVAILGGSVTNVKEDETLGKIIEIKHDNDYISIYQSLSDIMVKKGDQVTQGQVIGKSGTNELDKELGNHLHLEIYNNGQAMNPEDYLKTSNKKEN